MQKNNFFPVTIIGAGPAGAAAAIELKKYNIDFVLFEKNEVGGLIKNAYNPNNTIIADTNDWTGEYFAQQIKRNLRFHKIKITKKNILHLDFDSVNNNFIITTKNEQYFSHFVVVASGTKANEINFPFKISKKSKKNIFYDLVSLKKKFGGDFLEESNVAVVGAGDAAFDYALSLNMYFRGNIDIYNRNAVIKAMPELIDLVSKIKYIRYFPKTEFISFKNDPGNSKITIESKTKDSNIIKKESYLCILLATGRISNKDFYTSNLTAQEEFLLAKNRLFLAGDVKNGIYRQLVIALGDGIKTAMQIINEITQSFTRL